ncbi:phage tail protein I [Chitiniphilus purpureus]|uniref:Phage tail protein I n=1 Tax=Chitiniphilus purpureus TaxID=2981137 RepID=A0ABY6DQS0_9NEIS|nr:phage tail protein I [Chitiniphilus sp. CD1]UXY16725.1 phage tail protein I [Chitiniphilus sp. CD1]
MNSLLPPGAGPIEHALTLAGAQALDRVPLPFRTLWNPDTCPAPLLPYLAWAFSVDRWDASWSEATKRQVIRDAFYVHQHKGTIGALRRVVEPFGYDLTVIEWWQMEPAGEPGTFALEVSVLDEGISPELYAELERLVDDAKPLSRKLAQIMINLEPRGTFWIAAAVADGDTLTVYPLE